MRRQDLDTIDDKSGPFVPFTAPSGSWKVFWVWANDMKRKHQMAFQFTSDLLSSEVLLGSERAEANSLPTETKPLPRALYKSEAEQVSFV